MMNSRSIVLDFKVLKELELSVEEFLELINLHLNKNISIDKTQIDYNKLEKNLFIKKIESDIFVRQKSIELINFLSIQTDSSFINNEKKLKPSKRAITNFINENVDEFRNLWKGLKPGSMGSLKSCKEKLIRWMIENPDYNFEDIIKAAKLYLRTEGRNLTYLQRADYFIFKKEGKEESSRLSAFIDDIEIVDDNWTSELK